MDIINQRPGLVALLAFIAGLIIGLVVLGWGLFPVEYTGADPSGLFPEYRAQFVRQAAELYSFDNNQEKLRSALASWGGADVACELAASSVDQGDQARLIAAAAILNGTGCPQLGSTLPGVVPEQTTPQAGATIPLGATAAAPEATQDEGGSNTLPLLLGLLLLALLGLAAYYVWTRRQALMQGEAADDVEYMRRPTQRSVRPAARPGATAAAYVPEPVTTVPIARFRTIYSRGHDTYDDSFKIENANGDFLGECGVSISETLGSPSPRNVTAFEVWLFDKNDIRTITKVIMSEHAFYDEALKAKLAPKGEPVLARKNETIVLETATLIINADITELDYGSAAELPDASYFDRFTVELSAWAKEGDYAAPQPASDEEDLLDY